jgi:hypothetical protein
MGSLQAEHGASANVLRACVLSGVLHRVQEITVHSFKAYLWQQSYFDLSLKVLLT